MNEKGSVKNAKFQNRAGQREFSSGIDRHRVAGLLARRQYGKTTIASRIALHKMMKIPGHTVVFGSVKLDLGREIVRKEAGALQKAFPLHRPRRRSRRDATATLKSRRAIPAQALQLADAGTGKAIDTSDKGFTSDDFAGLYEACRLEFRFYHSASGYSRTKVVALNTSAVGETGDLILDEVGRVKNFREVVESVMPIIASNPDFRCIYTTTPPPDDTHYSFDLLAPPLGAHLPVNPRGNWYRSELGVWVLRITAFDAQADGVPLYDDDTGEAQTPEESRARAQDKDAWDRNYDCKFVLGGTAACGLIQLDTAQRRGIGKCRLFQVNNDAEFAEGLLWLIAKLGNGPVGLGWDLATTTSETSNPSCFAAIEQQCSDLVAPAVFTWKTADPEVAMERARQVIVAVGQRREGGKARRLCIDATNERYFAQTARRELGGLLPVELVIGSQTIEVPGQSEPITLKQYLGGQLIAELDDNHLALPPERYLREDWRLIRKERGQFVCEPDGSGRHGDTFDAAKYAIRALRSPSAGRIVVPSGRRAELLRERRDRSILA